MTHPFSTHPRKYANVISYYLTKECQMLIRLIKKQWTITIMEGYGSGRVLSYNVKTIHKDQVDQYDWVCQHAYEIARLTGSGDPYAETLNPKIDWLTKQSLELARRHRKLILGPGAVDVKHLVELQSAMDKPAPTRYILS